ncbi:MAG: peptide chain release factor N(5)-glutamine methyltransferase, partial [Steroidobacteraceae bacterium]
PGEPMGEKPLREAIYERLYARLAPALSILPDKPEENAASTLRALWFAAAGMPRSAEQARAGELPGLDDEALATLEASITERLSGIPLSHLTGRQRFMGLDLLAGPQALIPRKETELLARSAIRLAQERIKQLGEALVIDVCTGSGNVALAIAHHTAGARVLAADMSPAAVELARRNLAQLGLANRVEVRCGDLLAPFDEPQLRGQVDVLTCNPPYIASGKVESMPAEISRYEPRLAFDGGAFGLGVVLRLIQEAPSYLRKGGWLAFEVGAGQGPALLKRTRASTSFIETEAVEDERGIIRVILARRGESSAG